MVNKDMESDNMVKKMVKVEKRNGFPKKGGMSNNLKRGKKERERKRGEQVSGSQYLIE